MNNIIIILNNSENFTRKISSLFFGLEVSINCNVSYFYKYYV